MPAQRVGPLYGPLPDVHAAWAVKGNPGEVLYTPEDMLELILEMQEIRTAYDQISKLTIAMNSTADLSLRTVESIKDDVFQWDKLQNEYNAQVEKFPSVNPGELPIIKADVIEYSEEPLKNGGSYLSSSLQQVKERIARLQLNVCRRLDLCSFGLEEAICCGGMSAITPMYRS